MSEAALTWHKDILEHVADNSPDDGRFAVKDLPPGAAEWSYGTDDKIASLLFVCPCGCGSVGDLSVRPGYGGPMWKWDGDTSHPTMTPSIQRTSECRWHGYLTKGVFKSC